MSRFHHRRLPDDSTLLVGPHPPSDLGFQSERLQVWYNHTSDAWADNGLHAHQASDECFIILQGSLIVEVEGQRFRVGPREFCCFPAGVYHAVIAVYPPVETLMIRAPAGDDKVYQSSADPPLEAHWSTIYQPAWDTDAEQYLSSGLVAWGHSRRLARFDDQKHAFKAYIGVHHSDPAHWGGSGLAATRYFLSLFLSGRTISLRTFDTLADAEAALATFHRQLADGPAATEK